LASYGVSSNVASVNIDAVVAVILLRVPWCPYAEGEIAARVLEEGALSTRLYDRLVGQAAEIEYPLTRGRNMDTCTLAGRCRFLA